MWAGNTTSTTRVVLNFIVPFKRTKTQLWWLAGKKWDLNRPVPHPWARGHPHDFHSQNRNGVQTNVIVPSVVQTCLLVAQKQMFAQKPWNPVQCTILVSMGCVNKVGLCQTMVLMGQVDDMWPVLEILDIEAFGEEALHLAG